MQGTIMTTGAIAEELGVPIHRVRRVVDRKNIKSIGRAGQYRLFHRNQLKVIEGYLLGVAPIQPTTEPQNETV